MRSNMALRQIVYHLETPDTQQLHNAKKQEQLYDEKYYPINNKHNSAKEDEGAGSAPATPNGTSTSPSANNNVNVNTSMGPIANTTFFPKQIEEILAREQDISIEVFQSIRILHVQYVISHNTLIGVVCACFISP